jgi:hypothetical protein
MVVNKFKVIKWSTSAGTSFPSFLNLVVTSDNPFDAILEVVNILHPTEEAYLLDCDDVDDRRPKIGLH